VQSDDSITIVHERGRETTAERREPQGKRPTEQAPAKSRLAARSVEIYADKENHSFVNGE